LAHGDAAGNPALIDRWQRIRDGTLPQDEWLANWQPRIELVLE
jgi:hypothetical protein